MTSFIITHLLKPLFKYALHWFSSPRERFSDRSELFWEVFGLYAILSFDEDVD